MFFDDEDTEPKDCTCGKLIEDCDFYDATAKHMKLPGPGNWDRQLFVHMPKFSRVKIVNRALHSVRFEGALRHRIINSVPKYRHIRDQFLSAQFEFFSNAIRRAGATTYIDGTKSIRRAQLFARDNHCDMRVLHLIRDGRGFCASYIKHTTPTPSLRDAANSWMNYINRVDMFARNFPCIPIQVVRYEDLCKSTSSAIEAICRFSELSYEEPNANLMKNAHIFGNRMRRNFTGAISEDTSWKKKFDRTTRLKLTSIMEGQLSRFGYL